MVVTVGRQVSSAGGPCWSLRPICFRKEGKKKRFIKANIYFAHPCSREGPCDQTNFVSCSCPHGHLCGLTTQVLTTQMPSQALTTDSDRTICTSFVCGRGHDGTRQAILALSFTICSEMPDRIQTKYSVDKQEVIECYRKNSIGKVDCLSTVVRASVLPNIAFLYCCLPHSRNYIPPLCLPPFAVISHVLPGPAAKPLLSPV